MKNPEKADHAWAFEKVFDYWRDEPENAWQILLRLTFMPGNSPEDIAYIAAGPAEGLLTHHGEKFVDRFVEMARKEAKFRYLLGGVWKSTMPEQIWSRIQAVSGPPW
jgi:hypothetical protein